MKEERKNKFTAMAVTAGIVCTLLFGDIFFFSKNRSLTEENTKQLTRIDSITNLKNMLAQDVQNINNELADYKGKNEELDKLLSSTNKSIQLKEAKITKLINQNASLKKIQKEMKSLRAMKVKTLARIGDLEKQNQFLVKENEALKTDNAELHHLVESLQAENTDLERKVDIASVLKVQNVSVITEKKTKNGKYSKSTRSKSTDRFLVSFDLVENKVAEKGPKKLYLKITDPKGNLIETSESGFFPNPGDNISTPYSKMETVDYNNSEQKVTIPVDFERPDHIKGTYTVEFFCEGYFCGAKKVTLK
jgi:myosin heavy subunit